MQLCNAFLGALIVGCIATVMGFGQEPLKADPPDAEVRKLALIVGASNYGQDPLPNAVADAAAFRQKLEELGFAKADTVFVPDPTDVNAILDPAVDLAGRISSESEPVIFVFYFAGHGFQDGAWPYIVPTAATDFFNQSLSIDKIMRLFSRKRAGVGIFLLDSCRTGLSGRALSRITGDAIDNSRRMMVVSLATELNAPAADSSPATFDHSPYTQFLLRHVGREGVRFDSVLEEIATDVEDATLQAQKAVVINEASISRFYMRPLPEQVQREDDYWTEIVGTNRRSCVSRFARNHPGSHKLRAAINLMDSGTLQMPKEGDPECPIDPAMQ